MNNDKVAEIYAFVAKVEALLKDLEKWASESYLQTVRGEVDVSEETLGTYSVPSLTISDQYGNFLAEIVPIGTRILGANGRIDLRGRYDKAIVVDLNEGGPTLTTTMIDGSTDKKRTTKFYRGIDQDGWYWIDRTAQPKGHVLTKELFLGLLTQVSDYDRTYTTLI